MVVVVDEISGKHTTASTFSMLYGMDKKINKRQALAIGFSTRPSSISIPFHTIRFAVEHLENVVSETQIKFFSRSRSWKESAPLFAWHRSSIDAICRQASSEHKIYHLESQRALYQNKEWSAMDGSRIIEWLHFFCSHIFFQFTAIFTIYLR